MSEERKILDMLAKGQISVDEATELLDALKSASLVAPKAPPVPPAPPQMPRAIAKMIRVRVKNNNQDGSNKSDVDVSIPIGLAKFASKFIPAPAKHLIEKQGINVNDLLKNINSISPENQAIHIPGDGVNKPTIMIELI